MMGIKGGQKISRLMTGVINWSGNFPTLFSLGIKGGQEICQSQKISQGVDRCQRPGTHLYIWGIY